METRKPLAQVKIELVTEISQYINKRMPSWTTEEEIRAKTTDKLDAAMSFLIAFGGEAVRQSIEADKAKKLNSLDYKRLQLAVTIKDKILAANDLDAITTIITDAKNSNALLSAAHGKAHINNEHKSGFFDFNISKLQDTFHRCAEIIEKAKPEKKEEKEFS